MQKLTLESSVAELHGVGPAKQKSLERLGLFTIRDLLYNFPRCYEERGNVLPLSAADTESPYAFLLTVATEVKSVMIRRGLTISKFRAFDETGAVEVVFFNSPFVKEVFHTGSTFRFYGKLNLSKKTLQLTNPKYEPYVEGCPLPQFVPVYPLTHGVNSKFIEKTTTIAMEAVLPSLIDPLPENIRLQNSLPTLSFAIKNAHTPDDAPTLAKALKRLAFDEMLYFGIGISRAARHKSKGEGLRFSKCDLQPFLNLLPYELTDSQKMAVNDIYADTVIGKDGVVSPMARILVGDVGSGKTVCAALAIYIAAKSGYQSAFMAPTEILARQHYAELKKMYAEFGISCELLLGATTQKEKRRIYKSIEDGECLVVIGTHALLSDKFSFANLGLIITDEQHRFGVNQRAILKDKARQAHMLVMSATPIPRTLALAMYGDLDVSKITQMPKGRMRVDTFVVDESYRSRLNDFIKKQVLSGGQCYVVCPAIEASDEETENAVIIESFSPDSTISTYNSNIKNAVKHAEYLEQNLEGISVACLHGKMKSAEKDGVMSRFKNGEISALVSTTVIEVGVNVPNASLMIVENAERFGLAQLHQLRGRVGRGTRKSYCVLVSGIKSEKSEARLSIMRSTYDGFEIAEKDLVLRGPGDFFAALDGSTFRQSGGFTFKIASLCDDSELFTTAFQTAKTIITEDPELSLPEHRGLRLEADKYFAPINSTIS
ncbi:MAG: ATP-dependent DNA helicase RecG [Clostridia bacterium]|nr:ATP-dependent DNA helicase RecG [Clostridia bacterium]